MLRLAVIGGDGTGPEVVAEGLKVLAAVSKKVGFEFSTQNFDISGDRYLAAGGDPNKQTIPVIHDEEIAQLRTYDAIYPRRGGPSQDRPGHPRKGCPPPPPLRTRPVHQPFAR